MTTKPIKKLLKLPKETTNIVLISGVISLDY